MSIPVFILFKTSLILTKAGIDLANLKAWAYVASYIAFLLLLLFLIVVMMPLYIFTSDLRGILIDLAVIGLTAEPPMFGQSWTCSIPKIVDTDKNIILIYYI